MDVNSSPQYSPTVTVISFPDHQVHAAEKLALGHFILILRFMGQFTYSVDMVGRLEIEHEQIPVIYISMYGTSIYVVRLAREISSARNRTRKTPGPLEVGKWVGN